MVLYNGTLFIRVLFTNCAEFVVFFTFLPINKQGQQLSIKAKVSLCFHNLNKDHIKKKYLKHNNGLM